MGRFVGKFCEDYDLIPDTIVGYEYFEQKIGMLIARHIRPTMILDIGVGTGITTKAIIDANPDSKVVALDCELPMIEKAKERLAVEIDSGAVTLYHVDALDFLRSQPDECFDAVASAFTLHNCWRNYRIELFSEIFRVTKKQGIFVDVDKFAVESPIEYCRAIADQIMKFDVLRDVGRDDIRRIWIEHEIEDQNPERIMWAQESVDQLTAAGYENVVLIERIGQYAILSAIKP